MKELTPYELWQLDFYGDILAPVHGTIEDYFENGLQELDRMTEWTLHNEEKILTDYEY